MTKRVLLFALPLALLLTGCSEKAGSVLPQDNQSIESAAAGQTLHTKTEFSEKYGEPAYDVTDPLEAAKQYVTELENQPYVSNFELKDAKVLDAAVEQWTDSLRECVGIEEDNVMDSFGWTTDMIDRGIFTVVRVDYYANFDHTQTPTDFEGDCYMNVYMVQYEDTGTWQIYNRGYFVYEY